MKTYNELKNSKTNNRASCKYDAREVKKSGCNYVRKKDEKKEGRSK